MYSSLKDVFGPEGRSLIEGVGTSTEGLDHLQKPADVRPKETNISHPDVCNSFMGLRISFGGRKLQNY